MDLGLIDLDRTLSCGQVFRWRKEGAWWSGIVNGQIVRARQKGDEVEFRTRLPRATLRSYFRSDDDLEGIYAELSKDDHMARLLGQYRGLRLIRQDPWECAASYVLATNANVPRIKGMIERVCQAAGTPINDGQFAFPTPQQVVERQDSAATCGLGYRCGRFVQFAQRVWDGELNLVALRRKPYEDCVKELVRFEGVGNKVADCIAVFSLDHLEAFPIDVRIKRVLTERYRATGSYRKMSQFARAHFGPYAGYAQEYLYFAMDRENQKKNLDRLNRSGS
jgi:N-glycosylase/DNA lyase